MPTAPMGSPSAEQLRASAAQAVVMNEPKMVHETATYANEHQPLKKPMTSDENDPKQTVGQRDRKGAI